MGIGAEREDRVAPGSARPAAQSAAPAPAVPAPRALARTFVSLQNRDFRYLMLGTIGSGFGQWGQQIGVGWLVFVLTGSALQLGTVAFVGGLASLAITPFGGWLSDRFPRRTVIVAATLAGAAQAVLLAALVLAGRIEVWQVYAFQFLVMAINSVNQPARQAYVYDVSTDETLTNAVALNSMAMNAARIVGPPLAGGLIGLAGTASPFVFVAVANAVAAWATVRMSRSTRQAQGATGRNPLRDLSLGFRYLGSDRRLVGLLLVNSLPALFVYPYIMLMPVFAAEVLDAGEVAYGALVAMIAVGSLGGLFLLAYLREVPHQGRTMLLLFLVYLLFILAFSQSTALWLSLVLLILAGLVHGIALALNTTLFQLVVRNDMRGRGMAVWQMGFAIMPLGTLPIGWLMERLGPQTGLALPVLLTLLLFLWFLAAWPSLRRL